MRQRVSRAVFVLLTAVSLTAAGSGCRDYSDNPPPVPVQHGDPGDPSSYPQPVRTE